MQQVPSIEELRKKYAKVMSNQAVTNISGWTEPNEDEECDEQAYMDRILSNSDVLNKKIQEALLCAKNPRGRSQNHS